MLTTSSDPLIAVAASLLSSVLIGGCAGTLPAVAKTEMGDTNATASQHEALAAEYQRLAANDRVLSRRHEAWAAQQRQGWAAANQGRTVKWLAEPMGNHCEALAATHARAAEEYAALAEHHLSMARARRG